MHATSEIVNRAIKYLVEGLFVAIAAIFVPRHRLPWDEILTLGVVAAAVFAILDVVSPEHRGYGAPGRGLRYWREPGRFPWCSTLKSLLILNSK